MADKTPNAINRDELIQSIVNYHLITIYEGAYKGSPSVSYEEFCNFAGPILRDTLEHMAYGELLAVYEKQEA